MAPKFPIVSALRAEAFVNKSALASDLVQAIARVLSAKTDKRKALLRSWEGAIAFRLWTATLYPVEITGGQNFGEGQG